MLVFGGGGVYMYIYDLYVEVHMEDTVKALIQLHLSWQGESLPKWQHVTWTVDISTTFLRCKMTVDHMTKFD